MAISGHADTLGALIGATPAAQVGEGTQGVVGAVGEQVAELSDRLGRLEELAHELREEQFQDTQEVKRATGLAVRVGLLERNLGAMSTPTAGDRDPTDIDQRFASVDQSRKELGEIVTDLGGRVAAHITSAQTRHLNAEDSIAALDARVGELAKRLAEPQQASAVKEIHRRLDSGVKAIDAIRADLARDQGQVAERFNKDASERQELRGSIEDLKIELSHIEELWERVRKLEERSEVQAITERLDSWGTEAGTRLTDLEHASQQQERAIPEPRGRLATRPGGY